MKDINRIAIKLKPAAERMIKKQHPWVFEGSITKQSAEGKAGDLAIIYDNKKNKFLACGFYDPHSPIRIKLLQFHKTATIDLNWFERKIKTAFELRQPLLQTQTNSYRLIYGENDGFPGFICDIYAHVLVIKLYSSIWFPWLEDLLPILCQLTKTTVAVLRLSRLLQNKSTSNHYSEGQILFGDLENENVTFKEHGLRFSANVIHGHKTGYFLDHRHNRKRIGELAKDKNVLDVFAYAGGFSVHALVGGATSVSSLDISTGALEMATANVGLNPISGQHIIIKGDAFEELENLKQKGQTFDLIIIDPPSFAKQQSEIAQAKVAYHRLAILGAALIKKGGILLLASCSSRIKAADFFENSKASLASTGKSFKVLESNQHDIDHPITFPEGAYLKSIYFLKT